MDNLINALIWRFTRGFVTGAIGVMVAITPFSGMNLNELNDWFFLTAISLLGGGVSGGILAIGKYLREKGFMNLPF
mgnify:CR=1 FL=1